MSTITVTIPPTLNSAQQATVQAAVLQAVRAQVVGAEPTIVWS